MYLWRVLVSEYPAPAPRTLISKLTQTNAVTCLDIKHRQIIDIADTKPGQISDLDFRVVE